MKKIGIASGVLACVVCLTGIACGSPPTTSVKKVTISFEDKVIFSLNEEVRTCSADQEDSATPLNEEVYVTLQYEDTFECAHETVEGDEELQIHRAEVEEYYATHNRVLCDYLSLNDYESVVVSSYAPYIEYKYSDLESFMEKDYGMLYKKDSDLLEKVVVSNPVCFNETAYKNHFGDTPYAYPFEQALQDVGLTQYQSATGSGIKIGSIEKSIPSNANFTSANSNVYGNVHTEKDSDEEDAMTWAEHAYYTYAIFGGQYGIARDATCYFASITDYTLIECCEWLVGKGVHVVNISVSAATGDYDINSAYIDYLAKQQKVLFVVAAGNDYYFNNLATGYNTLCVGSNDLERKISYFVPENLDSSNNKCLLKPTLTAPGGWLYQIGDLLPSKDGRIKYLPGTSFAAPFVTGIVAILMGEYSALRGQPATVIALLCNSCKDAKGQTDAYDEYAGFGIVNYANAEKLYSQTITCPILSSQASSRVVLEKKIQVPSGATVRLTSCSFYNSTYNKAAYNNLNKGTIEGLGVGKVGNTYYTKLQLTITDDDAENTVFTATQNSNYYYGYFKNTSTTVKNYTIHLKISGSKAVMEPELCALSYSIV